MGKRILRWLLTGAMWAALALSLSGCVVFRPVDDLYAPPLLPEEYSDLQTNIQAVMNELGAEYAAINYGSNTSTVQLLDLDSDGAQETAAVFLRVTAAEERPLRVCLFRRGEDDSYRRAVVIEGEGSSINSVAYEDLTGDGSRELIVSWQMGAGVYTLSVYTLADSAGELMTAELMQAAYDETYLTADMDRDEDREILILRQDDTGEGNSRAEYYDYADGLMSMTSSAPLSRGMRGVLSAKASRLSDSSPAVYVTLQMDGGVVTDVLGLEDGALANFTRDQEVGVSLSTAQSYTEVAVTDINSDGIMEVPMPVQLSPVDPASPSSQYLINWRQFDRRGRGAVTSITYHSIADGWYLTVPDSWPGKITAARDDSLSSRGERAVVFYYWPDPSGGAPTPFLTVYRLTGNNRDARAKRAGRFILHSDSSTIYCALLDPTVWDCGVDEAALAQRFSIITPEWSSQ